ncbi:MAG: DUF1304 domain-containing protein [Aeromicrobium sp.]
MTAVALIFAGLAAALHVFIWTMESLTWKQPKTWKRFGLESQADAETTASLAFNQGYYNLFLAIGTAAGIVHVAGDHDTSGWTLIIFCCGSMVAAALVLVSTGKKYIRAASTQGLFPLIAVVASVIASR